MKKNLPPFVLKLLQEAWILLRYGFVGIINTSLSSFIMFILDTLSTLSYQIYTSLAYIAGMISSFILNRIFTFGAPKSSDPEESKIRAFLKAALPEGPSLPLHKQILRFALLNLSVLALTQVWQYWALEILSFPKFLGLASGMVFYISLGYLGNRLWVFKPKKTASSREQNPRTETE